MVINHIIHWIRTTIKNLLSNPLDGNLSNAFCYPSFDTTIIYLGSKRCMDNKEGTSQSKPGHTLPPRDMQGFSGALSKYTYWQLSQSPVWGGLAPFATLEQRDVGHFCLSNPRWRLSFLRIYISPHAITQDGGRNCQQVFVESVQARIQGRWNGWIFIPPPPFLSPHPLTEPPITFWAVNIAEDISG